MTIWWGALNARSRGLASHLLSDGQLTELASSINVEQLAAQLAGYGYEPVWRHSTDIADAFEAGVNARLAMRIGALWRWAGEAAEQLRSLLDDETRRTLRALLRGCVAGSAPALRLAATTVTPELDATAVSRLADTPTVHELIDALEELAPPWAAALAPARTAVQPDLLELERRLTLVLAQRARRAARRGDAGLRCYLADRIDYENAISAWLIATSTAGDLDATDYFLAGGRRLSPAAYEEAAGSPHERARALLVGALDESPAAAALAGPITAESMSERFTHGCIEDQQARARREPLSSAPTVLFLLRARAEAARLRRIIWNVTLATRSTVAAGVQVRP